MDPNSEIYDNNKVETYNENEQVEETENNVSESDNESETAEEESFEYPEYLDEDYKVPEEFEDEEKELNWYKKKYKEAIKLPESEKISKYYTEKYKNNLISTDKEYERLKLIDNALNNENDFALKALFADKLTKYGYDATISDEQAANWIEAQTKKEFGENYLDKFDAEDSTRIGSYSSKIQAYRMNLYNSVLKHNNEVQQKQEQYMPESEEEIQKKIDEQYDKYFKTKDMTREVFNGFVEEIKAWKPTLEDAYNAKYFDEFIKEAHKIGYEEGKKSLVKEIEKAGGKPIRVESDKVANKEEELSEAQMYRRMANGMRGWT